MAEFMYLFRGGDARNIDQSPEEMQAHMQKWGTWMAALGESGNFIAGQPLQKEGVVLSGTSGSIVTDGPFAEGKEVVGGYLVIKADSMNHASELANGCPIYENGGTVEVREIQSMDM